MASEIIKTIPPDRYYIVWILFFLFGIASAMPVHIFFTASTYFSAKLEGTPYQYTVENYVMLAHSLPTLFIGTVNILLLRSVDVRKRIIFSLSAMIFFFIVTAILAKIDTSKWKFTFFVLTLTIIILNSMLGGTIYQASVFGLVSVFPKEYAQALVAGQGISGLFTALSSILSLIVTGSASRSGFAYFASGVGMLVLCMIIHILLNKNAFARYYMETRLEYDVQQKKKLLDDARRSSDSDDEDDHVPYENSKLWRIKYIFGKVWPVVVAQLLCCGVSYCIVPSIASRAISIYRGNNTLLTGPLFIPIVCFLLFAVADVVGRLISRWILLPGQNQGILLLIISISRIIFIPLFMYCNVHPRRHLPVKIYSDIVYTILIVLLGISHGYINTLCSMYAPKRVPPKLSESAGAMVYLFLVIGVTVGTLVSFGVVAML